MSYILEVREESPDEIREFFQKQLGPVGQEGFMTGAEQLAQQVRAVSRAEGKAEDILLVLQCRSVTLTPGQRAAILATSDMAVLDRLLQRAAVAVTADEVFG